MPRILITSDDGAQRATTLPDRSLRIGRSPENDIVLPDANKGVSRAHAELRLENGRYVIVDLQSQNGTWLNGERVERAPVPVNAEIAIGLYRLRLQAAAPTNVADIPLYRPERAAAAVPPVAAARVPAPAAVAARSGTPKWILFAGGVAIGMVVILVARLLGPSSASSTSPTALSTAPQAQPSTSAARPPVESTPAEPPARAAGEPPASESQPPPDSGPAPAPAPEASEPPSRPNVPTAARIAARDAFSAARKLDAAGDWLGALRKYDDVQQADATYPGLDRAVKQVWAKLRKAGGDALKRARQYDAIGLSADALREYDKAAQWLPPDDPNRQVAQTRADQLRSAGK